VTPTEENRQLQYLQEIRDLLKVIAHAVTKEDRANAAIAELVREVADLRAKSSK
jgi:hypothetical protein